MTAFDLSARAIDWARQRFPDSTVSYCAADLFDLPEEWSGTFDLVNEIYTLQALPADLRQRALRRIAELVAPGGRILVVLAWAAMRRRIPATIRRFLPLAKAEIDSFTAAGLIETSFEDIVLGKNNRRHFVAVYSRPA